MSTQINVNVTGGGTKEILNQTVEANRADRTQREENTRTALPSNEQLAQAIAALTNIPAQTVKQFLDQANVADKNATYNTYTRGDINLLRSIILGNDIVSSRRPDELTAQKRQDYGIAGFWTAFDEGNFILKTLNNNQQVQVPIPSGEASSAPTITQNLGTTGSYSSVGAKIVFQAGGTSFFIDCFPISRNSCLAVFCMSHGLIQAIGEKSYNFSWSNGFVSYQCDLGSGQDPYIKSGYDFSFTGSHDFSGFTTSSAVEFVTKTWIVTRNTIREVSVPAGFAAALNNFLVLYHLADLNCSIVEEPLIDTPEVITTCDVGTGVLSPSPGSVEDPLDFADFYGISNTLLGGLVSGSTSKEANYTADRNFLLHYANPQIDLVEQTYYFYYTETLIALKSLGSDDARLRTPGAFFAFNNADITSIPGGLSVSNIVPLYFNSAPIPRIGLVFNEDRFDAVPELINPSDFDINLPTRRVPGGVVGLPPDEGYELYAAWDWGNSSYCRQQLASLGFSQQDLQP